MAQVADQLRAKLPKLAEFMDEAEGDVLAYMGFPADHWAKSTRPTGSNGATAKSNGEPGSSASFQNDEAIVRLRFAPRKLDRFW